MRMFVDVLFVCAREHSVNMEMGDVWILHSSTHPFSLFFFYYPLCYAAHTGQRSGQIQNMQGLTQSQEYGVSLWERFVLMPVQREGRNECGASVWALRRQYSSLLALLLVQSEVMMGGIWDSGCIPKWHHIIPYLHSENKRCYLEP